MNKAEGGNKAGLQGRPGTACGGGHEAEGEGIRLLDADGDSQGAYVSKGPMVP